MKTTAPRAPTSVRTPRPLLSGFAALNAVLAWIGGIALMDGVIDLGDELNRRLPFDSPVLGGLALMVVVAAPLTLLAWLAWVDDPRADRASVLVGVLLVGWIAVQIAFLRELSWFHPTYVAVGAVLIGVGLRRRA
ncbi:hypothetical protein [Euzebya sp.]|uniref:hypothetical protein n=1 Tax=Euzebya sp. TaxID=1971409 RepID=UPI003513E7AD